MSCDGKEISFDFGHKKKKKNNKHITNELFQKDDAGFPLAVEIGGLLSDRDYTYDELLNRAFESNPKTANCQKNKFVIRPPQVLLVGTKKTSFVNFTETCKTLHRQPKHLLDFLLAELGTTGSVDGNSQLILKGRFSSKQIENVLRRYIKEYVMCHTCRSPETILHKDTRIIFLQCGFCGSSCSVASIKAGFQAVTSKRRVINV